MQRFDHSGIRYGRLTPVRFVPGRRKSTWLCLCDCGKEKEVSTHHFLSGATTSCGCYNKERMAEKQRRHGMYFSRQFKVWKSMVARCLKPYNTSYKNYGARGISVCKRWMKWENFWEDMGPSYREDLELDRIDNDGNYEPGNCRWTTRLVNMNNKRTTFMVTAFGRTMSVQDWGRETGIKGNTIAQRIRDQKWTPEKSVTKKPQWNSRSTSRSSGCAQ